MYAVFELNQPAAVSQVLPTETPTPTPTITPSLTPAPPTLAPPTLTSIFTPTLHPTPEPDFPPALVQIHLAAPPDTPLVRAGLVVARDRIHARLDALGISDSDYFTTIKDDGTLLVEIPNRDDLDSVIATLQRRGFVEFVDFSGVTDTAGWEDVLMYTTSQDSSSSGAVHPVSGEPFPVIISGRIFASVTPRADAMTGNWLLDFTLIDQLAGPFQAFTEAHIGQPVAVAVDGVVLTVPTIQSPIEGQGVITGNFNETEARALASALASGPLPFRLDVVSITLLGP